MERFLRYINKNEAFSEKELEELIPYIRPLQITKGHMLQRPGKVCDHIFFVEKGLLRSYTIDENDKEHIIQFATEEGIISDRSSLFFNIPSEIFIDAVEDSEVLLLNHDFISLASHKNPEFGNQNTTALNRHIFFLQKRINQLLSATAENRYLEFREMYPDLMLRVPQWMIASYLGITPESLSRVRKDLSRKNTIL